MDERMAMIRDDPAVGLTVDGSGVGGVLLDVFGADVTGTHGECAHCHTVSVVGTMRVYMRGPGIVIRCPACAEVVVRIVRSPMRMFVDTSGAIGLPRDGGTVG